MIPSDFNSRSVQMKDQDQNWVTVDEAAKSELRLEIVLALLDVGWVDGQNIIENATTLENFISGTTGSCISP